MTRKFSAAFFLILILNLFQWLIATIYLTFFSGHRECLPALPALHIWATRVAEL
jgi:hypothetical protein